ncbi:hypothetical protein NFI96_025528 [Prochilodus magdalenae]|nr:hypothetical protein NFI96_025528 [Prochilodus magdalenae]
MTNTEMDQLANFLGHDIRIHHEFYLLPEKTLQLAKISKILMALEQGGIAEFQGKNLDEIGIEPDGVSLRNIVRVTVQITGVFTLGMFGWIMSVDRDPQDRDPQDPDPQDPDPQDVPLVPG